MGLLSFSSSSPVILFTEYIVYTVSVLDLTATQIQEVAHLDEAGRPGLACVALRDERDGVAGSAAGTSIRSLFNRAFMFLISSNFAAIVAANASAIAALLSACASAIEADAAVFLVACSSEQENILMECWGTFLRGL